MSVVPAGWLRPEWPAPGGVRALVTTRGAGAEAPAAPFGTFNLAAHVGDDPARVAANRRRLQQCLGVGRVQWLQQVHGTEVLRLAGGSGDAEPEPPCADGLYTRAPGVALAIMTADCLPILLCDRRGREIAALHAGWRGLAAGIVAQGVAAFRVPGAELLAWLGPAIGPDHFEVGGEVRAAFLRDASRGGLGAGAGAAFSPARRPDHYFCDLYRLARLALAQCGVEAVYGGGWCTACERERFFSYRAEGRCGRMTSLIWLGPG